MLLVQDWSKLANEVQVESSILTNFANYHLNSLNGKLNGSRKNKMHGSMWTKNGCQRVNRLNELMGG